MPASVLSLGAIQGAVKTFNSTVKTLGPITVGFFVLLAVVLYTQYQVAQALLNSDTIKREQLNRIESKIDASTYSAKEISNLNQYFLRQVCYNTADTETERTACNPPPQAKSL